MVESAAEMRVKQEAVEEQRAKREGQKRTTDNGQRAKRVIGDE
jgi:hypothetical protein